ncbi:MAG TPA: hypothetical protein VN817_10165 [Solirubrobacteraceae bacterium]|nr:hypothetical protein [Solirubrobacteraceae bacterium]
MTRTKMLRAVALLAVSVVVLAGPVGAASASKASIKAVLKSSTPQVALAEHGVVSAITAYKTSHEPAPVESAIAKSIFVLKGLRTKIASQSAGPAAVKLAKSKLVKGVSAVVAAYVRLNSAFVQHGTDPSAAKSEAEAALKKVAAGRKQLSEAVKLLS